jgi:integrase
MMAKIGFPLYLHSNGQWCKTIKGAKYYFGTDKEKALTKYLDEKDHLFAGRKRPRKQGSDGASLSELINLYADWCAKRVKSADLSQRSLDESIVTLKRLAEFRGKEDQPSTWDPMDYAEIKEAMFAPVIRQDGMKGRQVARRSATTVDGDIRRIKAFLKWAADSELMPLPRFGQSFNQSSAKQQRLHKATNGKRDLTAAEIHKLMSQSSVHFKPLILLGINGGFGAKDLAELTLDEYQGHWIETTRPKTGVERKVWLWPETRAAIDAFLKVRKNPFGKANEDLLFCTIHRSSWMVGTRDGCTTSFARVRRMAGLKRGTFYDLRRTFQTVAEGSLDFPAVSHVMGHAAGSGDMAAKYRQRIEDTRIRAVCEHVRKWFRKKV